MKALTRLSIFLFLFLLYPSISFADNIENEKISIIINKNTDCASCTTFSIRQIYGLNKTQWPDGSIITVAALPDDHPVHKAFAKQNLGILPFRLRRTWDWKMFAGVSSPVKQVSSEEEMISYIARKKGAIGYASAKALIAYPTDQIKILHVQGSEK